MDTRLTIINQFYDQGGEEERLSRSRQGQLEFLTTMRYIHRWSGHKMNILEIGAGTGRYSRALAQEGHNVAAIELVESNLEVLRRYAAAANIAAYQGDALDLSRFPDETFDLTLLLGPMYHLYTSSDQHRALDEGRRDFALSDEEFEAYTAYHWQTCEVRELLGASSHLLYIGQKNHTAIDCHFPL